MKLVALVLVGLVSLGISQEAQKEVDQEAQTVDSTESQRKPDPVKPEKVYIRSMLNCNELIGNRVERDKCLKIVESYGAYVADTSAFDNHQITGQSGNAMQVESDSALTIRYLQSISNASTTSAVFTGLLVANVVILWIVYLAQ